MYCKQVFHIPPLQGQKHESEWMSKMEEEVLFVGKNQVLSVHLIHTELYMGLIVNVTALHLLSCIGLLSGTHFRQFTVMQYNKSAIQL